MGLGAKRPKSLSDTKAAEDLAEQILTGEFTGDLAQRELCEPEILGEQLKSSRLNPDVGRALHVLPRAAQCIEMPAARGERPGLGIDVAGAQLEVCAQ